MMLIQDEQIVVDLTRAWWTSVLSGPVVESGPASGPPFSTLEEGDSQPLSRIAQAEQDRTETVIGTFESESRAQIAANYLASIEQIHSSALWVLAPRMSRRGADDEPARVADIYWDDPYWEPVQSALNANRAVLILIVDESGTNRARAILADDTGSLQTAVLPRPPQYVPAAPPMRQGIETLSALPVFE
jgi:hypothetical protein